MKLLVKRTIALVIGLGATVAAIIIFKIFLSPYYFAWRFESNIKEQPLFALIARYHPQEFAQFVKKEKQLLEEKREANSLAANTAQFVNQIFLQHLQTAPDDNIDLYLKATLELYHRLNGQDPRAVVKLENGDETIHYNLSALLEQKDFQLLLTHLLDAKRYLIESAIKSPVSPSSNEAEPLLQEILKNLSNQYGQAQVQSTFTPASMISPNVAAKIIIDFYSSILNAGKENAGKMIRYMAYVRTQVSERLPAQS